MNRDETKPQTETKAPLTPATAATSEPLSTNSKKISWLKFQTFDDPELIKLKAGALKWWLQFTETGYCGWLTLCGRSDTGKTFIAKQLWNALKMEHYTETIPGKSEFNPSPIWWPGFVNKLRGGKSYDYLEDTARWPVLYLDEIGASRDTTGFVADQLYTILGQRDKKATILTTNLTMEKLQAMDERIANRCVRHGGIVIEVNTMPFSSRPK